MSRMAALLKEDAYPETITPAPEETFLSLQLVACAEATGGLIAKGLAARAPFAPSVLADETGALRPEFAALARAYEDALLSSFSPVEVKQLRRLLARVEAAALKLSGRG